MKTSKDGHYSSPISAIRRTGNVAPGCVEIQLHLLSQQLPGQHGCHFCCIVVDPMQGLRGAFAPQVICKMSVTSFKKEVGKATNFLSFFARTFDLAVCRFQSRTFGFAFS